jgi:signal transduction histidine kinase
MKETATVEFGLPPLSQWADDEVVARQARIFSGGAMQGVLDLVDVPLLVLNQYRQAVFINNRLQAILSERPLEALIGKRPGDLFGCVRALETSGGCGASETCALCGARESILMGLTGREASMECRILSSNSGGVVAHDLYITTRPLDKEGERFAMVTLQDISDQKRRRALERIFFHDVLNTAGSLMGLSEIMIEKAQGEWREELRLFRLTAQQIVEEIQAQRMLMNAESRELEIRPAMLGSKRLLESLRRSHMKQKAARNRYIEIDPVSADILFDSDQTLLKRVLGNMIKNALEAVSEGQTVTLCCKDDNGAPVFSVRNPGYIGKRERQQIFMRHFSTKGSDRGLGTYSIKLLAEDYLGGRVWFESSKALGTAFFLSLPKGDPAGA